MSRVYILFRIEFDNMENRVGDAISKERIGVYKDDKTGTAHKKIGDYIRTLTLSPYLGHDHEIYPKFEIETDYIS